MVDVEVNRRTNVVINLGRKFIKLLRTIKIDLNHNLEEIFSLACLRQVTKNIYDTGLFWICDTLLYLITDNSDIFVEETEPSSFRL